MSIIGISSYFLGIYFINHNFFLNPSTCPPKLIVKLLSSSLKIDLRTHKNFYLSNTVLSFKIREIRQHPSKKIRVNKSIPIHKKIMRQVGIYPDLWDCFWIMRTRIFLLGC